MEVKIIGKMDHTLDHTFESANRVYDVKEISPTINCCGGGGLQPKIIDKVYDVYNNKLRKDNLCGTLTTNSCTSNTHCGTFGVMETIKIKQNNKKGFAECKIGGVVDLSYPDSKTRRGRVQDGGDVSPALTVTDLGGINKIESKYRIRKLTPLECWRLMGFTDEEFKAAETVNSNTQLYKQAGNSIVVDVLVGIFRNIIDAMEVEDMEKTAEIKVTAIKTDEMIDLVKFREAEPELFDELVADYPAEKTNYFIAVGE